MSVSYHAPAPDLRHLVGSYYEVQTDHDVNDVMRAEGPNFRCILKGEATITIGEAVFRSAGPGLYLFGPTNRAYSVEMTAGTLLVGAGLTPQGWYTVLGESAADMADTVVGYEKLHPAEAALIVGRMLKAETTAARMETADEVVRATARPHALPDNAVGFVDKVAAWLDREPCADVAELADDAGLSQRQTERLAKIWFGAPPKLLQRKYRALKTCDRLAASPAAKWCDVADPSYTDQSHMIREFRHFIGCTPGDFAKHRDLLVRETLDGRAAAGTDAGIRYLA